jgi:anti-anti-sigma factor
MSFAVEQQGDVTVLRVQEGKLTYPVLSPFFAEISQIVDGGARTLLVDLEVVRYIDSAAIGCLMDVYRLVTERGGTVRVSGLHSRVRTLLSLTGVLRILTAPRDAAPKSKSTTPEAL